ncbi:MAG: 23S rRNA (pseudouridine(1915)-N(3))-methyltransferase RlmH [Bacteroidales bacterium]
MKTILILTGKTNTGYISDGFEDYAVRIRKYIPFDILVIPELRNARNMPLNEQKEREAEAQLRLINNDDYVIALDEKGKEFTTVEFADRLQKMFNLSKKRIVFVVGGPWGFSPTFAARTDLKISMSRLTFSHQLVRLIFAEQLYRALTVIKGDPYHHE